MPDVRSIDLTNGIRIDGCGKIVEANAVTIVAYPGNQDKKEQRLNEWLQQQYEVRFQLADYEPDHRVRQVPPSLHAWERIEGAELVVTRMYVQAHIYTLSPLKVTVRCQNVEAGPIAGEWW